MKTVTEIDQMIAEARKELAQLEARRSSVLETIKKLKEEKVRVKRLSLKSLNHDENAPVSKQSSESEKISLFRMLFNREFLPLTDEVIGNHLMGVDLKNRHKDNFTIGVAPLLLDETCWFIALSDDITALTCEE